MLKKYTNTNFEGHEVDGKKIDIIVDSDFFPSMDIMNEEAVKEGLMIIVMQAVRYDAKHVPGAIVEPAAMSNHLAAHAVDVNFRIIATGQYCNSEVIATSTGHIRRFIDAVKARGIRWGGDFGHGDPHKKDPVHFDDGLNVLHPDIYRQKYNEIHLQKAA